MKNLYVAGLIVVCSFIGVTTKAQSPVAVKQQLPDKPLQFSSLPDKFECNFSTLDRLSTSRATEKISFQFGKVVFDGDITERVQASPTVTSINIRSTNFPGALFNLCIQVQPDNSKILSGRIINPKSGDVLVLVRENDRYYLQKQPQKFFMTE